jgi:hypothetical protein
MATWRRQSQAVPERLARFVESEWAGRCRHERHWAYTEACLEWLRADRGRALPFGEHGDAIDVLRESEAMCRRDLPCPHEYRPAQYRGPYTR